MTIELQDFTSSKRSERVKVPLNGVNYWCVPELAADYIIHLTNLQTRGELRAAELPEGWSLDDLAEPDPEKLAELEKLGGGMLVAMLRLYTEAMEPDSWATFREHMRALPKEGITPAERKRRTERLITFRQFTLVFRALMEHYTGRPTTPSDSSSNGSGGTGGTSTAGAQAAG